LPTAIREQLLAIQGKTPTSIGRVWGRVRRRDRCGSYAPRWAAEVRARVHRREGIRGPSSPTPRPSDAAPRPPAGKSHARRRPPPGRTSGFVSAFCATALMNAPRRRPARARPPPTPRPGPQPRASVIPAGVQLQAGILQPPGYIQPAVAVDPGSPAPPPRTTTGTALPRMGRGRAPTSSAPATTRPATALPVGGQARRLRDVPAANTEGRIHNWERYGRPEPT